MKWWTWKKKECVIYGKAGESRTQFKNISSHASSCGMSRTPRFFLRDGIFSSFLFFFSFFFFPPFPFVSFRYAYTNNICQSHLYLGRIEVQNETKKLRMISSNTWEEIFTLRGRRFHPSWTGDASTCKFSSRPRTRDELYFFLSLFLILNNVVLDKTTLKNVNEAEKIQYYLTLYSTFNTFNDAKNNFRIT